MARDATHDLREPRLAENEARARRENESRSDWFRGHKRVAFVCECADLDCHETLSFDREMYETLRASPTRFAVAVNHEESSIERVVRRHEECWIVEKTGKAAAVAKETVETTDVLRRRGEAPEVVKQTVEDEALIEQEAGREESTTP